MVKAPFQATQAFQVLVDAAAVALAQARPQRAGIGADQVDDASAGQQLAGALGVVGAAADDVLEQALVQGRGRVGQLGDRSSCPFLHVAVESQDRSSSASTRRLNGNLCWRRRRMASILAISRKQISASFLSTAGLIDPTPVEEIAQGLILASIPVQVACDPIRCQPDPAFVKRITPMAPTLPEISQQHVKTRFKVRNPEIVVTTTTAALRAQAELVAHEYAMLTTVFRAHAAEAAGNREAQQAQNQHLKTLGVNLKKCIVTANQRWNQFLTSLKEGRAVAQMITGGQLKKFKNKVWKEGFPALEVQIMKGYGLSDYDLNWLRIIIQEVPLPRSPVSLVQVFRSIIKINEEGPTECECVPD
jgi:hypothetical protein